MLICMRDAPSTGEPHLLNGVAVNYTQRKVLRKQWAEFIAERRPKHVATFVFNRRISVWRALELLERFAERMVEAALNQETARHRNTKFVVLAFPEHMNSNLHYHAAIRMSQRFIRTWRQRADAIWAELCPSGDILLQEVWGFEGAAGYAIKEQTLPDRLEYAFVYSLDRKKHFVTNRPSQQTRSVDACDLQRHRFACKAQFQGGRRRR